MTFLRAKRPRILLDGEAYKQLCRQVLRRDRWNCQKCGNGTNLQVHHIKLRSQSGDDAEVNLITLCTACHTAVHKSSKESLRSSLRPAV